MSALRARERISPNGLFATHAKLNARADSPPMAILSDDTVTGNGDITGYNPAPLTLYVVITVIGPANSHDVQPGGRYFDVGWVAPFFLLDLGDGPFNYQFDPTFIGFERFGLRWHQYTGGLDGFHYAIQPGVTVRLVLTDD